VGGNESIIGSSLFMGGGCTSGRAVVQERVKGLRLKAKQELQPKRRPFLGLDPYRGAALGPVVADPEERKHVTTAIGAARAERASEKGHKRG
jgi:hypothetical protein